MKTVKLIICNQSSKAKRFFLQKKCKYSATENMYYSRPKEESLKKRYSTSIIWPFFSILPNHNQLKPKQIGIRCCCFLHFKKSKQTAYFFSSKCIQTADFVY